MNQFFIVDMSVHIDVSTKTYPAAITLVDVSDLWHVLDGHGKWFAWSTKEPNARIYVKRHRRATDQIEYLHRLILGPCRYVDHRNGDGLDNRRANLRPATSSENNRNRIGNPGSSSRYKGVWFDRARRRWIAGIKYARKSRYLGSFTDEESAARAYDAAALERFGEFAHLNFGG